MRVAFYAPLKAPDHPVPSGDRRMARLLLAALRAGGHDAALVSDFRSFLPAPDPARMRAVEDGAEREVDRLASRFAAEGAPDLWFTYHGYYKAPDLLGPRLSAGFGLPYALAEATHAGKRAHGPWAAWHGANAAAIGAAARHICFTPRDAAGLAGLAAPGTIVPLPPFIEAGPSIEAACPGGSAGPVDLVAVAMMRPGDKARSHAVLAEALARLPPDCDWRLTLVGDGPARPAVEALFSELPPERLVWAGERDAAGVAALLARCDLYVWPGIGEAYGIAYLEAAAAGLPVLAMDCGGVASVVTHGVTGLLTPEGDVAGFAAALAGLIAEPTTRERLGAAGRRIVREERTVARAAAILSAALGGLPRRG